ncbi:MAG: transcription-repair coupling factor, partial [Rhodocyclaceae bacterium]|nr:transcription-repair coupling factor [Rhodocyclaceae bacterium]
MSLKHLPALPAIDAITVPKSGKKLELPPLAGSADALALARIAASGRRLLVITASPTDALRLQEEIRWFAPQIEPLLLPDWETLPYDSFSPHQDLVSERLATLHAISTGTPPLILVLVTTALSRLAPPAYLAAYTFFLRQGERLDADGLRAQMTLAGYDHVT